MTISVVAPHLQQPIADLVAKLIARPFVKGDRVSANFYENGYAASAILLLAAMVESMIQRDRYFLLRAHPATRVSNVTSEYLKHTLSYRRHAHVRELFDVRNSLAHNHMWEVEHSLRPTKGRVHKRSQIVPGTHMLKLLPKATEKVPRTKTVRFNLLPSRIDRTDLAKALGVCNHALTYIDKKGQIPTRFSESQVIVRKRRIAFSQLERLVKDEL